MAVDILYWSSILLCNFNGTNGSTTFVDDGPIGNKKTLTSVGSAALSTTSPKFGTASASFNGTSQRIDITDNSAFDLGTDDFTIEAWVYILGNSQLDGSSLRHAYIFSTAGTGASGTSYNLIIAGDGTTTGTGLIFETYLASVSATKSVTVSIPQNQWNHITFSKNSANVFFGVNGIVTSSTAIGQAVNRGSAPSIAGSNHSTASWRRWLNGRIDSLRILKGVALYTADYTVPTSEPDTSPDILGPYVSSNSIVPQQFQNHDIPTNCGGYLKDNISTADFDSRGNGYLNGIVKFRYPPDLPVDSIVYIICEDTKKVVTATISSASDGTFRVDGLRPGFKYSIIAFDKTGTYGASIASGLTPTGY